MSLLHESRDDCMVPKQGCHASCTGLLGSRVRVDLGFRKILAMGVPRVRDLGLGGSGLVRVISLG